MGNDQPITKKEAKIIFYKQAVNMAQRLDDKVFLTL